ncbi:MAG TPA: BON domain-containing protein [Ktedonobacteraceae bacterium]|nr:BON domain-containing protein [Ktedonobacteraceae bacterium]
MAGIRASLLPSFARETRFVLGGNGMLSQTDAQVNQEVFDELIWDPALSIADLDLTAVDGRVLLR